MFQNPIYNLRPGWQRIGVFILIFLLLQGAWYLARNTAAQRTAIDGAAVAPAAWLVNQFTPDVHALAVRTSIRAAGGG